MQRHICGVYLIHCQPTGKVYIGSSRDIANRWWNHMYELRKGTHGNTHLQRAWDKYGPSVFSLRILKRCTPQDQFRLEQLFINKYQAAHRDFGFNQASVVNNPGHDLATRQKMSQAAVVRWSNPEYQRLMADHLQNLQESNKKPKELQSAESRSSQAQKAAHALHRKRALDPEWAQDVDQRRAAANTGKTHSFTTETKQAQLRGASKGGQLVCKQRWGKDD